MTTSKTIGAFGAVLLLAALACGSVQAAATLTIVNNDGLGEGFNDPAARAPVGGNPGLTLGDQRLFVFQHAASIWGGILSSSVEILVRSQFNPQTCSATSAVLGSAGPVTIHRDFVNAPLAGHWYHQALANKLSGADLSLVNPDINATFNSSIDAGCFGPGLVWYYGFDGNEGVNIELLPVILHEMGHGLGFSTSTSGTTGAYNNLFPTIYDHFLMDNTNNLHWDENTAAQRVASAISVDHLVWDGPQAIAQAATYLGPRPQMVVNSPGGIAGTYPDMAASFGPGSYNLSGDVVLVDDAAGVDVNDGCEAIVNSVNGKIALIHRGNCTFVLKAQAAQAAGAIAMIVANNTGTTALPPMGGSDPAITIPCVGISFNDGQTIEANLGSGVNVTLGFSNTLKAGADANGKPLCYAPNPFQSGSSVSHWDVTMSPNTLMEPAINNDLHNTIDLALGHFKDIGWFIGTVPVALQDFACEGRFDGVLLRWRFADPTEVGTITVERAEAAAGPWSPVQIDLGQDGAMTTALDRSADADVLYYYHLRVTDREGQPEVLGMASGRREVESIRLTQLSAPAPNPAVNGTAVQFRIGTSEPVDLTICDVSGRQVRTLQSGRMAAGQYNRQWDGRNDRGDQVPAGVYFIRLSTSAGVNTQRVTIVR